MPFHRGRISDEQLDQYADAANSLRLTYNDVGATKHPPTDPSGFRRDHYSVELPNDPGSFVRACEGLRAWAAHEGAGARVAPKHAPLVVGQNVAIALALPGLTVVAPCRIVWVDDEPNRFGFAYGTLEGHPETGEEAFVIERTGTSVRFDITACSKPDALLARLGAPVSRRIQIHVTQSYLDGLRRYVQQ